MNLTIRIISVILLTTLNPISGFADQGDTLEQAKDRVINSRFSETDDWRHLVQYTSRLSGRLLSEIQSSHSFFASDGTTNPENELLATIEAMYKPLDGAKPADDHPRCRFIARYQLLSELINFPNQIKSINCLKFKQWVNIDDVESVSLVFASGYFKNPASYYGHPLLKFNTRDSRGGGLLDITINNGAIVPANENLLLYMARGIFGGYEAAFSDTRFYRLNHSYSESDLRDLWDYQLELTQAQKKRVIYYSWELLEQRFTYKFFSNNCGYFLEDLLQYALGRRVSPRNRVYTVPANTFFNIMQATNHGKPLVKKLSRTPSRHSRLNENYFGLTKSQQAAVHEYVDTQQIPTSFETNEQREIIDTLTDYYSFLISKSDKPQKNHEYLKKRAELYAKRLALKSPASISPDHPASSTPPHTGSRPSLVRLAAIHNSELGDGVRLRIRPASYDLLDLDGGHVPSSTLNMFNIEATAIGGQQRLTRFDLVGIKTLNISRTGLPGDGGTGWGLRLGLERANNSCLDCLLGHISGSRIKAKQISSRLTIYAEGEISYHSSFEGGSFRSTGTIGAIASPLRGWKSQLLIGRRVAIDGDADSESVARWENRFGDSPSRNVRFDVNYDGTTEVLLGYGLYW